MQYTKSMIDLIRQLRKQLQLEFGVKVRISDPDLLSHMCDHYRRTDNRTTKALIKELLQQAGSSWFEKITLLDRPAADAKMYRGQTILTEQRKDGNQQAAQKSSSSVRIYRGRVVSQ